MSIQKNKYTSKKTGKTKTQFYASVWCAEQKRSITGPMRDTEKEARQDETDIQREIAAGRIKATKKKRSMTVNEIYSDWHDATAPPVYSNNTWQVYKRFYADYIQEIFGDVAVANVAPTHIQKYVNIMKERIAPETLNKCLSILTNIFDYAVQVEKCISSNPASGIRRCKIPKKKKLFWRDEEVSYFLNLDSVKQSHYYPMLCLSAMLGPRPGEVCGLRESSLLADPCYMIDFERGYDNYECETDLKTGDSHRTPPIPKYLYKIIYKRLLWKREMRLELPDWGKNDYLFVSQNGNPIKPHQYYNGFKRLLSAHNRNMEEYLTEHGKLPAGGKILPDIPLYGLRTSFATNNMRRRPNAALISSIMGNSPKTLIQFYTQSDIEMQQEVINDYAAAGKGIS